EPHGASASTQPYPPGKRLQLSAARPHGRTHCWAEEGLVGAVVALAAPEDAGVLAGRGFGLVADEPSVGAAAAVAFLALGLAGGVARVAPSSDDDAAADFARCGLPAGLAAGAGLSPVSCDAVSVPLAPFFFASLPFLPLPLGCSIWSS